jgi:Flp pilus assembly protein TadG
MSRFNLLRRDQRGTAVIEIAISLPILVGLIYGIFEFCQLYEANAGMQHALGEGARFATLYDTTTSNHIPTDASIKARMQARLFGPAGGSFNVQDPVTPPVATCVSCRNLTITYTRTMNFLFFTGPTVTLTRSKLAYTSVNG